MNVKRFVLASIAVLIVYEIIDSLVHMVILSGTYMSMQNVWRPDMMQKMWLLYLVHIFFAFLFVYIFIKGYENKGIIEGVRYGVIIGLFMNVIGSISQHVVYPIPLGLAVQWLIYGLIQYIACGTVAALIYKPNQPRI